LGSVKNSSIAHAPSKPLSTLVQMLVTGRSKFYQPHLDELRHFVDCVINDKDPSPSGHDGLKNIEAIRRAYENEISLK
jgi:predicted dehydrogenase